jgi:hypothetical protein
VEHAFTVIAATDQHDGGSQPGRHRQRTRGAGDETNGDVQVAGTTYYATVADEHLAAAQRTLDSHITSSVTGRCLACGSFGPCVRRESAVRVFSRSPRLPMRRPGATRPELVGARLVSGDPRPSHR